jgi:bacillithiol synthase
VQISPRHLPPSSALFSDYLDNWQNVRSFYSQEYSLDSIASFARQRPRPDNVHMGRLCTALAAQQKNLGSSLKGVENLAAGAVAVITGQQPGLFTGPYLSILKAISVIKVARSLEQSGVRAAPVFWIAAEDHDHEEIETTWVLNRDSRLCRARVNLSDVVPAPVGWLHFREEIRQVIADCMSCLPQSDFSAEVSGILESSYLPGKSPVECFGSMMAKLFAGTSLILVDPLHPELKKLAQPTMSEAVRHNVEIREALIQRGKSLRDAGYHEQVKVDENFTGLFAYRGRARQVLRPDEVSPELELSPNALLRPVVQDSLFPTAVYIGGPAEVAYFAQASVVYETLQRPMPPIFPRISATILEPRVERLLKKYGIGFLDVFHGREFLKSKCVSASYDVEQFNRVRGNVGEDLESLRGILGSVDPTLLGALDTSMRKSIHQLDSLRTRFINAATRRDEILARHLDGISNSLFPEKKFPERILNVTSFLSRYGIGMIRSLDESLSLDSRQHQLVEI